LRVIAGALGGRTLVAPRGSATRPTSDRVREALFSALGDVTGTVVLDLFAGTGALGIESLSRGAARATFVERARPALAALRRNIEALDLSDRAEVLAMPAQRAIAQLSSPYDLVFFDPPYAELALVAELADELAKHLLSMDARLVVEHATRDASPVIEGFVPAPPRVYGDTALTFYRRIG
jgi:16S rRNA (guanine966-N2)-methyltransferase